MAKAAKKVTKKAVKKTLTNEEKKIKAEIRKREAAQKREEKAIREFQKRNDDFGLELDKLCKKYNVKAILQGYDVKSENNFTMGFNIKNQLESNAMRYTIAQTFKI